MVGIRALNAAILVRIQARQQNFVLLSGGSAIEALPPDSSLVRVTETLKISITSLRIYSVNTYLLSAVFKTKDRRKAVLGLFKIR